MHVFSFIHKGNTARLRSTSPGIAEINWTKLNLSVAMHQRGGMRSHWNNVMQKLGKR